MGLRRRRSTQPNKVYKQDDLEIFDLLEYPVWVFDIDEKAMFWANDGAVELWNAESLDSLLSRSYSEDMSESTERRLNEYMAKFQKGETVRDQWTLYPKGQATPVHLIMSGIQAVTSSGPRMLMLAEAIVPQEPVDQEALRGVEMLRHLPVAVCSFDLQGQLMSQNPESLELFGSPAVETSSPLCSLQSRFVDKAVGQQALESVLAKRDYSIEAEQQTQRGWRWFSISLRLSKDPVTSQPVVLYSARDTTEVMEAKKEAELANNKKSEFLAVMAHELRTPLHQVMGFMELLSQTQLTDQQLEYVSPMQSASLSLMSVMNDLLDYTKIEAGKMELERIPFEVKGVVEGCKEIMHLKTMSKGLTLESNLPVNLPMTLMGDPNRLRQILLNLLDNAVKFTETGGLTLSVTNIVPSQEQIDQAKLRFQVQDTGTGMSPTDQEHIFGKDQHATVAVARQSGGIGLGLAICKRLVETMGGSICLESDLGKGTKVTFEIPFDTPPTQATQVVATHSQAKEEKVVHNLRVLVAEDNKINQKVIKAMLQRMGHQVTLANNGALAVEQVEVTPEEFDVILMDKEMPVLGGIEATKLLRSKGYSIPIVGLTASYQPADRDYYKDAGMNDCMAKPARLLTVQKVLEEVTKPKGAAQSDGESEAMAMDVCGVMAETSILKSLALVGERKMDYQEGDPIFGATALEVSKSSRGSRRSSPTDISTQRLKLARLAS